MEDEVSGGELGGRVAVGPVIAAAGFHAGTVGVDGVEVASGRWRGGECGFEEDSTIAQDGVGQEVAGEPGEAQGSAAIEGGDFDLESLGGFAGVDEFASGGVEGADAIVGAGG